jgi:hypothetical protein
LEQHIVNRLFWEGSTLKDYFYEFWSGFTYTYDTVQYNIENMVENAKSHAKKAKEYEDTNMPFNAELAELEIKKIVPSL